MEAIVSKTADYVRAELEGLCSAHDFFHIERVWKLAQRIRAAEGRGDALVIELAALLHESFDEKFYTSEKLVEKRAALECFLHESGLDAARAAQVFFVVNNVGFGKSLHRGSDFVVTSELAIVEDADRLEAIGAIAVARTFAYGGKKGRAIHDPAQPVAKPTDKDAYHARNSSSINHFYEKLLLLKDLLHTPSARAMAKDRHDYMEGFLKQFLAEWDLDR